MARRKDILSLVLVCALAGTAQAWQAPGDAVGRLATDGDVSHPSKKGSVLIYPKVEIRWDSSGTTLLQDTFISLSNDYYSDVYIALYFVDERHHCARRDTFLTMNEPAYWSAATGMPKNVGAFTLLGSPYADPEGSGELILRGYIVAFAVDLEDEEINWNHLSGGATVVNYPDGTAWEYGATAFRALTGAAGDPTGTPGELNLDGVEFDAAPGKLAFDFYAVGAQLATGPASLTVTDTDLTLLTVDQDLGLSGAATLVTTAAFHIRNENEMAFREAACLYTWDEWLLGTIGGDFLLANLQTNKGWALLDGETGCDIGVPRAIIGVSANLLQYNGTVGVAGAPLAGIGTETAQIEYTSPRTCGSAATLPTDVATRQRPADGTSSRSTESRALSERVSTHRLGSVVIFPKVEVRWSSLGELTQDTFIAMTNEDLAGVRVLLQFVAESGESLESEIYLTGREPTYWSAATGAPKGVPPFTDVVDPYPDPEGSGEQVLRGYVLAWAVNEDGHQIHWNHLSGSAMVANSDTGASWAYGAYVFQALDQIGEVGPGDPIGEALTLNLDGVDYDSCAGTLLLDFYASNDLSYYSSAFGEDIVNDTDLTLMIVDQDLRADGEGLFISKADFWIWNENEMVYRSAHCVERWDEAMLSYIGPIFRIEYMQTSKGRARIEGITSTECDTPETDCTANALLGVAAKLLTYDDGGIAATGRALAGSGTETAVIQARDCNENGVPDSQDVGEGTSPDFNGNGIPDECDGLGDLNCDGTMNNFDIDPFVLALTSASQVPPFDDYYELYPDCDGMLADINGDGTVNNFDIDPFVELLTFP